jgi:outer membrane translocation and assembly module TamA
MGFGMGARTLVFGFLTLRIDAAWPVEEFTIANKPNFILSLGQNF